MRAIDADELKEQLEATKEDEYFGLYKAIKAIDNAPTIEAGTVPIHIINEDGASLDGYLDKSRQLIFTKYGIVGVEVLKAYSPRKYTIIEDTEGEL